MSKKEEETLHTAIAHIQQVDSQKEECQNLHGNTEDVLPQFQNPLNYPPVGPDNSIPPEPPAAPHNEQDIQPIKPDWTPAEE